MLSQPNWSQFTNFQIFSEQVKIVEQIGNGTNGIVYKAYTTINQGTEQEKEIYFAVKRIDLKGKNVKKIINQCEKENKFLASIDHPNIMKVYFSFSHVTPVDKYYFVGMELGLSDLNTIIEQKKISYESDIFGIAQQIWRGLNFLQEQNTAHRDLKPANVILGQDGLYKLCDFSEIKFGEENFKTETNTVAGTVVYLAPELFSAYYNGQPFSLCNPVKTDTFSFGVLLLQTILRCKQFNLQGINSNQQTKTKLLNSNFSTFFRDFLSKCLEFDPKKRWTFKDMKSIFNANSFELNYHIKQLDGQIEELQLKLNTQEQEKEDLLAIIQIQEQELSKIEQLPLPSSQNARKKKDLDDDAIAKIWNLKFKNIFKMYPTFKEREIQVRKNCGLNLSSESGLWTNYNINVDYNYYYYASNHPRWKYDINNQYRFGFFYDEDEKRQRFSAFTAADTQKAIELVGKLSQESGFDEETCLKAFYFNLWNYHDALNELVE